MGRGARAAGGGGGAVQCDVFGAESECRGAAVVGAAGVAFGFSGRVSRGTERGSGAFVRFGWVS